MSDVAGGRKAPISQFLIRDAESVNNNGPVTPVKIAPPPTVKRAKSLKSERKFKRYVSVPNTERETFTLPRSLTSTELVSKTKPEVQDTPGDIQEDMQTDMIVAQPVDYESSAEDPSGPTVETSGDSSSHTNTTQPYLKTSDISKSSLPEPASWQAIVNTHRRGSSMTFVSTENWAQFEKPEFKWTISDKQWEQCEVSFHRIKPLHGFISGKQSREYLINTGLSRESLAEIWDLADMDHDGSLSLAEFAVAMHCVKAVENEIPLPRNVPAELRDSLLLHISNQNTLLSSHKSPERSALRSDESTPKGSSVTFGEEFPRSRPRPTRKLHSTTPLHLPAVNHQSSDFSESEDPSSPVVKKLDMGESGKSSSRKSSSKHRSKKIVSSESESQPENNCPTIKEGETANAASRRERAYEDMGEFGAKIEEGDEDAQALLSNSDDEKPKKEKVDLIAPPSKPPPKRTRSVRPSRPPPALSTPAISSPALSTPAINTPAPSTPALSTPAMITPALSTEGSEPAQSTEGSEPAPEMVSSGVESRDSGDTSLIHDTSGYELLTEQGLPTPDILVNEGGIVSSDDSPRDSPRDSPAEETSPGSDSPCQLEPVVNNSPEREIGAILDLEPLAKTITHLQDNETLEDIEADELRGSYLDLILPDLEALRKTGCDVLKKRVEDYEIHNDALLHTTRQLKIELIKVQEQKQFLLTTLNCMKKGKRSKRA